MQYTFIYFHIEELNCVFEGLKAIGFDLKPEFKRYEYTEIIAKGDDCIMGKCENIGFIAAKTEIDSSKFNCQTLLYSKFEIVKSDESFREFSFGKFKIEDDTIKLDVKFDENLFYNLIPALQTQIIRAEILLKESNLRAKTISKEESEIIKEISMLSEKAKKTNEIEDLEKIMNEVSRFQVDFFRKFMQFKDINEEVFTAITKFEAISNKMGEWFVEKSNELRNSLDNLRYLESKYEQTLNGIRDLFSLVSIRVDMLRNKEYLEMQKRTSSLQAAAAVIEFVAVFYYSLKVWEHFVPIGNIPKSVAFALLAAFTTLVVLYTELLSEIVREKRISKRFIVTTLILTITLLLMYYLPTVQLSS